MATVGGAIITNAGISKLIEAHTTGVKIMPKEYSFSSTQYQLDPTLVANDIISTWKRKDIELFSVINDNTVEFLCKSEPNEALETVSTVCLYLEDGTLFAIANPNYPVPPFQKQTLRIQLGYTNIAGTMDFTYIPYDDAAKLRYARTISISGAASGSASFDGSSDIEIVLTMNGYEHDHNDLYIPIVGEIPEAADLNTYIENGIYYQSLDENLTNGANYPSSKAGRLKVASNFDGTDGIVFQEYLEFASDGHQYFRARVSVSGVHTWYSWKRVANSADVVISNILAELKNIDGSGSGLDADLLDGKQASDFLLATAKGAINGVASLDSTGKVPSAQLPSYVDDVLEYADLATFPATGETGKIYVALDTSKAYRWSGSVYVEISAFEGLFNIIEDETPQLGGALDCNGKTIDKSAVRQIADASIASGTHTFNYVSGDMQQLTATGAFGIVLGGFPTGQVSAFIIDAVNWGAYTVTHPANMLFAAGEAPLYTVSGKDRLLIVCDKDGALTLHVVAQDIKTMVV